MIRLALVAALVLAAPAHAQEAPAWRAKVRDFAAANLKHPAWGFSHSVRDYDLARALAAKDGVTLDEDVLWAAAYLHDVAAFPSWAKQGVDHADRAAELAGELLAPTGFPMAKLAAVQAAIRTHMYDRAPESPEALYLHDADALDWLGAVGVARVMALVDEKGGAPDGPTVMGMLAHNLATVPDRVLSPAGRAMMPERRERLRVWIEALKAETDGLRTL